MTQWTVAVGEARYHLWTGWVANWESGERGGHAQADTMEEVLRIFPPEIANEFHSMLSSSRR